MPETSRKKRLTRQLDDLPGLFDDIDISRDDIAGDIITKATATKNMAENEIPDIAVETLKPVSALKFISFGSGSSGNCAYIGTNNGGILIDAGVNNTFVTEELMRNGIDISAVAGILLTHDHGDHLKFAYAMLRRNRHMLLYCTPKTLAGLLRRHSISRRIKDYHKAIYKEFPIEIAGLTVTPFEVSHDGTDNVGFCVEYDGIRFVVTTDTGIITPRADFYMRSANALMIESNYDATMLRHGPYAEHLKARIASEVGHLDNIVTSEYVAGLSDKLSHVFLCHLSLDNNTPEIALNTLRTRLTAAGRNIDDLTIEALPRFGASRLFVIRH